jgi:hypothetical protein
LRRIKLLLAAAATMAVLMVVNAAPAIAQDFESGDEVEVEDAGTLCEVFSEVFPCSFFTVSDDSGGDVEFSSAGNSFESDGGDLELTQNVGSPGIVGGSLSGGNGVGFSGGGSSGGSFKGGGIEID